ncbi:LLM class flavin-dependent oxidoreductase [Herbiconiux sp. CPCC 203407]|uniref:LLM class flavin-dependent oxidoreductase n=1 Tax=Herbiconiux oxytropis TaxID=2970915 RepID=A0AA42BU51_9MICO|nr:LLM class flavin-dependent oxidoreductase [Herbiconiux oxytropis]MCS5722577.1 LLM class flavin-dependent oxidoreductase [Herbiconiux oxytropis]MCS5726517.1 LLM class flavin-dependent oxidoreductase [Herbiconiux oxytropis]
MKRRRQNTEELSFGYFFPTGRTNFLFSDEASRRVPDPNGANLTSLARTAEEVGFDSLFIADNWSGHQRVAEEFGHQSPAYNASLLAMAMLASTSTIGVISTIHTTHHKPAHVARMGATLDDFSGGRWGWNIVTGFSADEAALFGEEFVEHDLRYTMAAEFVDIVLALWADTEPIDVEGDFYRVRGRIKLPRPVQRPHPLLVSAGASPAGVEFAARYCDQLVTLAIQEEKLQALDAQLAELTGGRRTVAPTPFSMAIVREGDGEAEEEHARLLTSLNRAATFEIAGDVLGSIETARSMFEKMGEEQAALAFGSGGSVLQLIGTPEQVAEKLLSVKRNTGSTNVLINFPLWSDDELRSFRPVLEILREAGVWTPPSERDFSW